MSATTFSLFGAVASHGRVSDEHECCGYACMATNSTLTTR
ncbi:hypothetical protein Krac_8953 [Ktedonobacter racemifer DSM 44963]|uniref:Uncharacterized protein n=1 Tax=Ktedonobacter racemifer DSM 44963 TaxID=485913 RepID=D6TQ25_KTERA|nr:hypothetical protein Krac_8953 [Ktedonobacter racemifer DSM 44963]